MPTREEMIAAIRAREPKPSREEMIAAIQARNAAPKPAESSFGDKAMQAAYYATRPLDYAGGLARTGVAGSVEGGANLVKRLKSMVSGEYNPTNFVTSDDAIEALKGNAPPTSEYLKRAGVPEGGSLSDIAPGMYSQSGNGLPLQKGGFFDPSVRGVAGAGIDMALDPLTYFATPAGRAALQGLGRAGKVADKVLHPAETALMSGGKSMYKNAPIMKAADAVNDRFNKGAASDVLFDRGITGTGRQIADKAEGIANKTISERNVLLAEADEAGALLDMTKATEPAQQLIEKIRTSKDPNLQGVADSLEERVKQYIALNPSSEKIIPGKTVTKEVPIGTMPGSWDLAYKTVTEEIPGRTIPAQPGVKAAQGSAFKSSLYNDIGDATWDNLRKTPKGQEGTKALARGLDQETSGAVNRVLPGVGDQIDTLNDTAGALLTPRKALENAALQGEKKNLVTSVDGALIGLTHANPTVLAAKKTSDLLKTNWLRTKLGRGMYMTGENVPLLDEIIRREALNQSYKKPKDDSWTSLVK